MSQTVMSQTVANVAELPRRWWVLAIVVSAHFIFTVDAFIVNVALPTIAVELHASAAQVEAVIAIYLIGWCDAGGHRRQARRYPRHPGYVFWQASTGFTP